MDTPLQKLVVKRLNELGLGAVEAATKAKMERTYIRDIVEGKKTSIRTNKIDDLAAALHVEPSLIVRAVSGSGDRDSSVDEALSLLPRDEQDELRADFQGVIARRLERHTGKE
ncbi:hypothetical protein X739_00745 [Mesorhizobium sp. LNHC220B00]|nr:hypothetical protein [Mesorhizobium sp. LNHC220B00]ESY89054.1 hypothetical protein X739_00745 [Mesorhizobium sp. LNHC220B00]